jgi:hypothetical protein
MDRALITIDNTTPTVTDTPTVSADSVILFHAAVIKTAWNKQVIGIIETGQLLLKAKKEMSGTRKWLQLFDPNVGNLPFCEDTAQLLMKIARHSVLSNAEHVRYLPPHWGTLAVLSKATPKQLEKWIADGTVNINTERKQAQSLVSPKKPTKAAEKGIDDSNKTVYATVDVANLACCNGTNEVQQAVHHLHALACDATANWTEGLNWDMVDDLIEQLQSRRDANKAKVAEAEAWAARNEIN